jgi:hypothetical protein
MRLLSNLLNHNSVVRALKNARNELIDRWYRNTGTSAECVPLLDQGSSQGVCISIAYNTPWCIDVLTVLWSRFVKDTTLVVADNSSSDAARLSIQAICADKKVTYFPLPKNPEWSPNRSHGIAMNWIFHNLIQRLNPPYWGFLDHDCFPIRPYCIESKVPLNGVFGLRRASLRYPKYWNLWAGFCFYRGSLTAGLPLDFKHRVEFGLDTGGSNWLRLYSALDPQSCSFAGETHRTLASNDSNLILNLLDESFLHVGGASYRKKPIENAAEFTRFLEFHGIIPS